MPWWDGEACATNDCITAFDYNNLVSWGAQIWQTWYPYTDSPFSNMALVSVGDDVCADDLQAMRTAVAELFSATSGVCFPALSWADVPSPYNNSVDLESGTRACNCDLAAIDSALSTLFFPADCWYGCDTLYLSFTSTALADPSCCAVPYCCNYGSISPTSYVALYNEDTRTHWTSTQVGPTATSDWYAEATPTSATLADIKVYNVCALGCHQEPNDGVHPTAFYAQATGWDGASAITLAGVNGYPDINITTFC